jgi:hypothetical protein
MHDFFAASAGVAGALIGLLFVAISVAGERLAKAEQGAQLFRIRAYAALLAFVNALAVSLFSLIPGDQIGTTATVVSCLGLAFVMAALLSLVRLRQLRWATARDGVFLAGLAAVFALQLNAGLDVSSRPGDSGSVEELAILVTVCFFIGIARAWEVIGGPSIGISYEVAALIRGKQPGEDAGEGPEDDSGEIRPEDGAHAAGGPEPPGDRQA